LQRNAILGAASWLLTVMAGRLEKTIRLDIFCRKRNTCHGGDWMGYVRNRKTGAERRICLAIGQMIGFGSARYYSGFIWIHTRFESVDRLKKAMYSDFCWANTGNAITNATAIFIRGKFTQGTGWIRRKPIF